MATTADNDFTAGNFVVNSSVVYSTNTKIDNESYVGEISLFTSATMPNEYLLCDGSAINKTTNPEYSRLVRVLTNSTTATSCYLPDFNGKHPLGWSSTFSSYATSANSNQTGNNTLSINQFPGHSHASNINYTVAQACPVRMNAISGASISNFYNNYQEKDGNDGTNTMKGQGNHSHNINTSDTTNTSNRHVSLQSLNVTLTRAVNYTMTIPTNNNSTSSVNLALSSYKLFFGIRYK